ncbi:MAG: UDP-N-acetylmuramoyl-tripeptide--D-alanyl-D-alanine ligase [Acidobacteria bacterium]|nr:UDP-N-acetylmuramoyl-tripeptide--D-alanyl-D-alanine ligase [Acidobacteriota bacterium]MYE42629.1 UDP-N-acetylmuramoyl-tripeptide--D-alanyl-D-alanine ligase [Acidobacteriota bacterium]
MRLHGDAAARTMGGALEGPDAAFTGVSIDSRTLAPGDLFFAIRGPRFDGHTFVPDALRAGASGVVVDRGYDRRAEVTGGFLIRVADPTEALGALAREQRLTSGVRIVAITGSLGKTTTKEAAAAAIGAERSVFRSRGNLNNQWGLPLSLLAREDEEVGVVELGMSAPGEIRTLTEIAAPDCGVLTTIAEAHLEYFGSLEAIAAAKGELYETLPAGATAVVNADDERVRAQAGRFSGRRVTYGFAEGVDVRGWDYNSLGGGIEFAVSAFGGPAVGVSCLLRGRHNASNVLAGLAAATVLDVSLDEAAAGVRSLKPLPGRGQRIALENEAVLVDETYNSSPRALKTLLLELRMEPARRRILVVGDMLELGDDAVRLHRECGHLACSMGLDLTIGVGPLGQEMAKAMSEVGERVEYAESPEAAAKLLKSELAAGDLVLLKASRAVGMERAVEALRDGRGGDA